MSTIIIPDPDPGRCRNVRDGRPTLDIRAGVVMGAGWVSDDTTKHAAEIVRNAGPNVEILQRYPEYSLNIAAALAEAGLLCTPQERNIIDAAIAETEAEEEHARLWGLSLREPDLIDASDEAAAEMGAARVARRVAVAEQNQHRNPK